MALITRSKDVIYLLDHMKERLVGVKLPSVGDVMHLYLHKLTCSAKTKLEARHYDIEQL